MVANSQQRGRHMGIAVRDSVESSKCVDAEMCDMGQALKDANVMPLVTASA